jgi:hypothetical protein
MIVWKLPSSIHPNAFAPPAQKIRTEAILVFLLSSQSQIFLAILLILPNILTHLLIDVIITYMTKEQIAYYAGLFDGEGSISIIHLKSPRKDNPENRIHRLGINIIMSDKEAVESFYKDFGQSYGFNIKPAPRKNSVAKVLYRFQAFGTKAMNVLKTLFPYLKVKKERAGIAIEFQEKLLKIGHNSWADRSWEIEYCNKMRFLNHHFGSAKKFIPCWFKYEKPKAWNKGFLNGTFSNCLTCGKKTYSFPSYRRKYCSQKCYFKAIAPPHKVCKFCGKKFRSYNNKFYCSRKCQLTHFNKIYPRKRDPQTGKFISG